MLQQGVDWSAIAIAAIGIVPATLAALAGLWARGARSEAAAARVQATAANQAVNDVGPDQPKLRDLVASTNSNVLELQGSLMDLHARVAHIENDRRAEASESEARQAQHDLAHAETKASLDAIEGRLDAWAPVVDEWIRTHPEIPLRDDFDDDGGST